MNPEPKFVSDKYLQVPSLKERTETSISKPTRNGALKPLYATSEIKPVFNNDSISTSLLRPKDRKVSPTQKKLRFSLNLEITEPSNRHFNSSTSSEVFSSEHADESDLNPSALTNTTNIDLQNSEYLPFADDEESEEPKWGSYLDTNILDDCDIDSISDEEDNPNSELQLGDIDDSEMGERPTKCALQSEPSPTEDDYDEFLSFLKKDSMQYSVVS